MVDQNSIFSCLGFSEKTYIVLRTIWFYDKKNIEINRS